MDWISLLIDIPSPDSHVVNFSYPLIRSRGTKLLYSSFLEEDKYILPNEVEGNGNLLVSIYHKETEAS